MSDIQTKPRARDLLAQMGPSVYREAYKKGMSLSAYLEREDPSEGYKDGLDAFGRVLKEASIKTRGVPEFGIPASRFEEFFENPQARALVPEWISRVYRSVQAGRPFTTRPDAHRSVYGSADDAVGSWARPWAEAAQARWDEQIAPAIPISQLVATTTNIDVENYRSYFLVDNADQQGLVRVAEFADIPRFRLVAKTHQVGLYKYGRVIEQSYEQMRRMRLDKVALHIQRIAVQAEVDKLTTIMDVLVNGDGNANTAAENFNLTDLDSGTTAGNLTLKAWLAFKMKFANPYMLTTAIAREDGALKLLTLNTGSGNVPLVEIHNPSGLGYFTQINPGLRDNVALGWTGDAPANVIVGFDRRFAIERLVEIGGTISEIERFTTNQTQTLTITEVEGYSVFDEHAAKTLTLSA